MSSSPSPADQANSQPAGPVDDPEEGESREVDGRTEFWNGTVWISAAEAVIERWVDPEDVGKCVTTRNAGGGAIG